MANAKIIREIPMYPKKETQEKIPDCLKIRTRMLERTLQVFSGALYEMAMDTAPDSVDYLPIEGAKNQIRNIAEPKIFSTEVNLLPERTKAAVAEAIECCKQAERAIDEAINELHNLETKDKTEIAGMIEIFTEALSAAERLRNEMMRELIKTEKLS